MKRDNKMRPQDFPYDLSDEMGEIVSWEQECPGVYSVADDGYGGPIAHEYYIVEREAAFISQAAKSYGRSMPNHPELLRYDLNDPESGKGIMKYEVYKYRVKNRLPLPEHESILTSAVFAAEYHPDYFGAFAAPRLTPRGFTTRYQALMNGVFVLETDQCERLIAICYPIWDSNLSDYGKLLGEQTAFDRKAGIDRTFGYLFFTEENGCLALFELLAEFPHILPNELIDPAAMVNAIWQNHPDYSAFHNRSAQEGLHDILGMLLLDQGAEVELSGSTEDIIPMIVGVGTDYLRF